MNFWLNIYHIARAKVTQSQEKSMKDIISLNLASCFSSLFTRNLVFAIFFLFVKQSLSSRSRILLPQAYIWECPPSPGLSHVGKARGFVMILDPLVGVKKLIFKILNIGACNTSVPWVLIGCSSDEALLGVLGKRDNCANYLRDKG